MIRFDIHTIDSAPAETREHLQAARDRFGVLPNLLAELAGAPAALDAYLTLNRLLSETSLSPQEQQVVLAAASGANRCDYCVAAHLLAAAPATALREGLGPGALRQPVRPRHAQAQRHRRQKRHRPPSDRHSSSCHESFSGLRQSPGTSFGQPGPGAHNH
jgi:AhpD family alkylhydroperoxidase